MVASEWLVATPGYSEWLYIYPCGWMLSAKFVAHKENKSSWSPMVDASGKTV
jgi:hypothetical protein